MSFLSDYELAYSASEIPPNYTKFAALSIAAGVLQSKVWADLNYYTIWPNLYMLFVGPPGNRKTAAKDQAADMLEQRTQVVQSAITKEKLMIRMQEAEEVVKGLDHPIQGGVYAQSPMSCYLTELSTFLGRDAIGMIDFLTNVYDRTGRRFDNETKNQGDDIIVNPVMNLLGCTTQSWISDYMKQSVISGGFTRRCLVIRESKYDRKPLFAPIPQDCLDAKKRAGARLRKMQDLKGCMSWDADLLPVMEKWYQEEGDKQPVEESARFFHNSKHVQTIKFMMLISCSERDDLTLTMGDFGKAQDYVKIAERNIVATFEAVGRNELKAVASSARDLLVAAPQLSLECRGKKRIPKGMSLEKFRSALFSKGNRREIQEVVDYLQESGQAEVLEGWKKEGEKRGRNWICLK